MRSHLPNVAVQHVPSNTDDAVALARKCLHPQELALLSSRASPKRLAEFVAGRVAARAAVSQLLSHVTSSPSFLVLREGSGPTGCPRVVTSDASLVPQVSISHADGVAVAAASFARIGIDIATIEHQQASFIDETFCDNELAAWAAWLRAEPTSPLTVTTAFAVKEAALKWLGTGFGTPLRAIQIVPVESSSDRNAARGSYSTPLLRGTLTDRSQRSPRAVSLTHSRMGAMVLMSVCGTIA